MPQFTEGHPAADGGLDARGLRAILEICRLDLDSLRLDADCGSHASGAGQGELERRLCRLLERLERTAGTLDEMLDRIGARPSTAAEVLAHEADHRIKNSLQTIVALLEKQATHAETEAVREALRTAGGRVGAVAQVHATLHAAPVSYGIIPELNLGSYLGGLCTALERVMGVDGKRRALQVEVEPLAVSPTTAQHVGLIVTELVTNALRHAFRPDQPGAVRVTGVRQGDGSYWLCVADDGKGLPHGFDCRARPKGLGLRLVNVLADQLRARLTVNESAGARFTLCLPASATEART